MAPRIGIPLCLDAAERWREKRRTLYLDQAYPAALTEAGGLPLLLPLGSDPEEAIEGLDGLLIPGGDDFLPESAYPESVVFNPVPSAQLAFDRSLLAGAQSRGLPVLGICYGAQLLASERGGKLLYHLPLDQPTSGEHQLPENSGRHAIVVEKETWLAGVVGRAPPPVNSLHHQGIDHPGEGMRVSARAPDGVVEAIESRSGSLAVGIQWHPERLSGATGGLLLAAFVNACRGD